MFPETLPSPAAMAQTLARHDERIVSVEKRVDEHHASMESMGGKIDSIHTMSIYILVGVIGGLLALMGYFYSAAKAPAPATPSAVVAPAHLK